MLYATMMLRPDHPDASAEPQPGHPRLNLLLSCATWRHNSALDQLPSLLAPLGIHSITAASGDEAAAVIKKYTVHIAVVDLTIPLHAGHSDPSAAPEAGPRLLQLLRRLEAPPPVVVVRPPQPAARESARGLTEALREGAFAVLDQPVKLESMLEVMRRILRRHYADLWPT